MNCNWILHSLLNSLDHGDLPLHHDRMLTTLMMNCNCGTFTVFCGYTRSNFSFCPPIQFASSSLGRNDELSS